MVELNGPVNGPSSVRSRAGVCHRKIYPLKMDMTPMVDLGFLLITFFVFTAELTRPKAMDIKVPHDGEAMPVAESKTITILIGGSNKVFYYYGKTEKAIVENNIMASAYDERTGIGKAIREKQAELLGRGID
jgi:biopolymer transport protein ExbD